MSSSIYIIIIGFSMHAALTTKPGSLCRFYFDVKHKGLYANCSHLNLKQIPEEFPENTTSIDLSDNNIGIVRNNTFLFLHQLRYLDLSNNKITNLEVLAFHNCDGLAYLDLHLNQVTLTYSSYPSTVFDNLCNLEYLNLKSNVQGVDGTYPNRVFQNLQNLTILNIDAFDEPKFGIEFGRLKKLKKLILGNPYNEKCNLRQLKNHTFVSLSSAPLEVLDLSWCQLQILEVGAFEPLTQLKELLMQFCSPIGIKTSLSALSGLTGRTSTMKEINLKKVHLQSQVSGLTLAEDGILNYEHLKYLSEICVDRLILSRNAILYLNMSSLVNTRFSKCISYIDISVNRMQGDTFDIYTAILTFKNLKYIDISLQPGGLNTPFVPPKAGISADRIDILKPDIKMDSNGYLHQGNFNGSMMVFCPKYLEYMNVSAISGNVGPIKQDVFIKNGKHMTGLNFSFVGLSKAEIQIKGLESLKMLDLSGNMNMKLADTSFDTFPILEALHLSYYSFSQDTAFRQGKRLLQFLPKLKFLYINYNHLAQLPANMFEANPLLEYLDLSSNIFNTIPFDILLTANLKVLDMTSNSLGYLDSTSQIQVDTHTNVVNGTFHLMLTGNLFSCGCGNFYFLIWLKKTMVNLDNEKTFPCLLEGGMISNTSFVSASDDKLWRNCIGTELFYISMSTFISLLCGILTALLLKTNHTSIVYRFMNLLRGHIPKPTRRNFRNDVYVYYADADYRWIFGQLRPVLEDRNLRLFLWDRDSLPGDSIPDQIVENMPLCWKIILYLTPNFENDTWSYVSMMAAINCMDNLNPERVILILSGEYNLQIPNCLLDVIPETCIFNIPQDTTREDVVWQELLHQILNED